MLGTRLPTTMCMLFAAWCASGQTSPEELALFPKQPHFEIVPKDATLATRNGPGGLRAHMEAAYAAVWFQTRRLDVVTTQPSAPISVAVFDDQAGFENYAAGVGISATKDLYGFYDRDADRVVLLDFTRIGIIPEKRSEISRMVNPIRALPQTSDATEAARRAEILKRGDEAFAKLDQLEEQIYRTTVQHEVAHAALSALGVLPRTATQPAWLSEGMASQFEVSIDPLALDTLGISEFRLNDYLAAAKSGRLLPWHRLLTEDDAFKPSHPQSATAYAQAWLLTHWAVQTRPAAMAEYIRRVRQSRPKADERGPAFDRIFDMTEDRLAEALGKYARLLTENRKSNEPAWQHESSMEKPSPTQPGSASRTKSPN